MSTPGYVRRFDRVTRALNELSLHAGGLPIAALAKHLDTDAQTLRAELRAYFRADVDPAFSPNAIRQTSVRFHDADGVDADPALAEFVSASPRPTEEVGADYVTVGELARIYRAGQDLLAIEPANTALEGALNALKATVLAGLGATRSTWLADLAASVGEALRNQRRIELTYARAWQPGVRTRIVEPYRLVKTRRGWELDAGFVADGDFDGRVGTFLLSGVRSAEVLEAGFERPAGVDALIAANRRTTPVDLVAPQDSRWVVDRFSESVEVLGADEDMIRMRAHLLPPVEQRLGLLLLVAGPDTWVNTPTALRDAGTGLAREPPRPLRGLSRGDLSEVVARHALTESSRSRRARAMTDQNGPDDGHVIGAVLGLADADETLPEESKVLVLAALEGAGELAAALSSDGDDAPAAARLAPPTEPTPPAGAFVTSIRVEGFRGIGPAAELTLQPTPGLTVVAGRNGSGKSSFSEALELALTGNSYRWKERNALWSEHWRNLHSRETRPSIQVKLAEEGAGTTTVGVDWGDGAGLGDRQVWVQRQGQRRESGTDGLGWSRPLELYRPILSYEELGGILQDGPSKLFDTLDAILGIEQATDALQRLAAVAKELEAPLKAVKAERTDLKKVLAASADERAAHASELLRKHQPDLAAVEAIATGRASAQPSGDLARLRGLTRLTVPPPDEVRAAVAELRVAAKEFEALAADAAELTARRATLLRQALDLHRHHGDGPCPVCGSATLDAAWQHRAEAALAAASADSERHRRSQERLDQARDHARRLVRGVGEPAQIERFTLGALAAALAAWQDWSRPAADDHELAARLDTGYDDLAAAYELLRDEAAAVLGEHEDAWTPLALRLAAWVKQARSVQADDPARLHVDAAHRFMKSTVDELRAREFDRLADKARDIWAALRQDSNVDLGAIRPKGQGNRRHIELVAAVDGEDAGALGVMSQGELHALALALFIPRATMPGSPFRFIVLDDPIQAMDPAKVDGFVRVLAELATDRQVIVLSHDDRLTSAVRQLGVDARILEVSRSARSAVEVRPGTDPAQRHIDDAFAIAWDPHVPVDIKLRVLPGLCRAAVEAAARDAYLARRFRAGDPRAEVEQDWQEASRTRQRLGLALSGDASMNLTSWLAHRTWRRPALDTVGSGTHDGLRRDAIGALREVERLVGELRRL